MIKTEYTNNAMKEIKDMKKYFSYGDTFNYLGQVLCVKSFEQYSFSPPYTLEVTKYVSSCLVTEYFSISRGRFMNKEFSYEEFLILKRYLEQNNEPA